MKMSSATQAKAPGQVTRPQGGQMVGDRAGAGSEQVEGVHPVGNVAGPGEPLQVSKQVQWTLRESSLCRVG